MIRHGHSSEIELLIRHGHYVGLSSAVATVAAARVLSIVRFLYFKVSQKRF